MTKQDYEILHAFVLDFSIPTDFVQVARVDGIRFTIYSNEQGSHNLPHVHIDTGAASLSVEIETQRILAISGKINPPQLKKATNWVKNNQELLKRNWNEFSNGIEIPL